MIMTIDPGIANLGYAIGEKNKVYETGVLHSYSKQGTDFERVKNLTAKIQEKIKKYNVSHLIIEDYRVYGNQLNFRGAKHGEKTIKVITGLQFLADSLGITHTLVDHNSWKADFKRVWQFVSYSGKFKELNEMYMKLCTKKQDHELDAFKMLVPHIISFKEAIYG